MKQPAARLPTKNSSGSWRPPGLRDTAFLMALVVDDAISAATEVVRRCGPDKSDHRHRRLLRTRRERPRRRAAEHRDELAAPHSITSSARARRVGGTSRPIVLAAWRLITSSNLVDCWTGRSAGLAPFRIRPA